MIYFTVPLDFYGIMAYLGRQDGTGIGPYQFLCTNPPTDAASYSANVTWVDSRTQPTWTYITTGAGATSYANYVGANIPPSMATTDTVISNVYAAYPKRVPSVVTRSLNTAFMISTTRDAYAHYSVQIASTLSVTTGQTGSVSLQISADGVTYGEIARSVNGNTGTLSVGLNLTQTVCPPLQGLVPANNYVKLVTTGTAAINFIAGQETLL